MVNTMAIAKRCPTHLKVLVLDEELGLLRCPVTGCYYSVPAPDAVKPETI